MAVPMNCHAPDKFIFEKSSFLHEKSRHKAVLADQSSNHAISVSIPGSTRLTEKIVDQIEEQEFFLVKNIPLATLIAEEFIGAFVKKGSMYMVSHGTRIDNDTCVNILPSGHLVLNVDKDTYEELGLVGKPSQFHLKRKQKYVIEIDITSKSFKPGKKNYERVKWCFTNRLNLDFDFLVTWCPRDGKICSSSIGAYFMNHGLQTNRCILKSKTWSRSKSHVPLIKSDLFEESENSSGYREIYEWLGAMSCRIDGNEGSPDDFLSSLVVPTPTTEVEGTSNCHVSGLITSETILSILESLRKYLEMTKKCPWISLTVHGFQDSTVSSRRYEHGFNFSGDNQFTFLLFPNDDYWLMTAVGSHDVVP